MALTGIAFVLLVCARPPAARGQDLQLEDSPSTRLNPSAMTTLPLNAAQRAILLQAVKSHEYPRAETLLVDEIERNPKSHALLAFLGSIFFMDGKYLNCAIAMKKADALLPLSNRDRFTLSLSYIILNHRDWARPELEKLASMSPGDPLYPYWLGRLDYDAMQFKAAAANLRKALDLDPTFMKAYVNLALTYEALGQYDDAVHSYQEAIRLNRQNQFPSPWPPLNLATLLIRLGRLGEAETYLRESLRYDPRFPKAHFQMGLLLEKDKKDQEAILELSQAVQYDPAYSEPHYILGRIYERMGKKAEADAEWQKFQKLKKENPHERPH